MKTAQRMGGSFAPPLSDKTIGEIESQIGKQPARKQDAARTLFKAVTKWWELPESDPGSARGRIHASGVGAIVPLDGAIAATLYDDIPWPDELEAIGKVFADIDGAAAEHRSRVLGAWRQSVCDHLWQTHVSPLAERSKMLAAIRVWKRHPELVDSLLPSQIETIRANEKKVDAWWDAFIEAMQRPASSPLPRPEPDKAEARDGLHSLLWHVKELNLDREPITSDKV